MAAEQALSVFVGPGEPPPGGIEKFATVADFLASKADSDPERIWLRFEEETFTIGQVLKQAGKMRDFLAEKKVGRGDVVGLLVTNRPDFIWTYLGINLCGAVASFFPTEIHPAALERYAKLPGMAGVLAETHLAEHLGLAGQSGSGCNYDETIAWYPLSNGSRTPAEDDRPPSAADASCIVFTSGSSGPPKAVIFSHRYVLEIGRSISYGKGMVRGEKLYFCNPMFHADGIIAIATTTAIDGELHLARRFSVSKFWDDVARFGSTVFYYVGASLSFLARNPEPRTQPAHALRFATGGGATREVAESFERRFNIPVLDAYSQSECLVGCSNTLDARRPGTAGRPYPGVEIRIVDDMDEPVPLGELGNIVFRPPRPFMSFSGYWNNAEVTVAKTRNLLHHMGDRGRIDSDGFVTFEGRSGNGLRRRGENLQPEDIEYIVENLNWVQKAAAVGVASEHGDEDILLLLLPHAGMAPGISKAMEDCRSALPRVMQPRWIDIVEHIPMTPTFRISRKELPARPGKSAVEVDQA